VATIRIRGRNLRRLLLFLRKTDPTSNLLGALKVSQLFTHEVFPDPPRTAIAAFRAKQRLPATGSHKDLHAALLELLPTAEDDQVALPSSARATPRVAPDLRLVQSLLEYLGCSPGPVDGKLGPRTRAATAAFQRSQGGASTGAADAELLAALEAEAGRAFGRNRLADTRLVQQLLAVRGFAPGAIDGLVGPRTRAAVTAFLRAQGGPRTDAIDAGLLSALLAPHEIGAEPGTAV